MKRFNLFTNTNYFYTLFDHIISSKRKIDTFHRGMETASNTILICIKVLPIVAFMFFRLNYHFMCVMAF